MISSRSVTDGVSQLKLVYSSMIFVDNKLTLICQQLSTVPVCYTQVILLI